MRTFLVGVATAGLMAVLIGLRSGALNVSMLGVPMLDGPEREGTYAFLHTQAFSPTVPVGYSSCRPLRVQVNAVGLDDVATVTSIVRDVMAEVSAVSGLELEYAGPTTRRPPTPDSPGPVSSEVPVLVAFADSDEVPGLAGDIAGLGGSRYLRYQGMDLYVTGEVTLDKDYVNGVLHHAYGRQAVTSVALHEFGHVLGLAHVDDRRELMAPRDSAVSDLGPGDRRGLAILGHGPCVEPPI